MPDPDSTYTLKPFFVSFFTELGTIATLFSPSGSFKIPSLIIISPINQQVAD